MLVDDLIASRKNLTKHQPELFQDDIYADTIDVEEYTITARDWLAGGNADPKMVSLRPAGMAPCKS
jgi:hypothetical protein